MNDGILRCLAVSMYASQLIYLKECVDLAPPLDPCRFINVLKMVESAMRLEDIICKGRQKTDHTVLDVLISYGSVVRQHWTTECISLNMDGGNSQSNSLTRSLEGLSFGQTSVGGKMLQIERHISSQKEETSLLKNEISSLRSDMSNLTNLVNVLVRQLSHSSVRRCFGLVNSPDVLADIIDQAEVIDGAVNLYDDEQDTVIPLFESNLVSSSKVSSNWLDKLKTPSYSIKLSPLAGTEISQVR